MSDEPNNELTFCSVMTIYLNIRTAVTAREAIESVIAAA